MAKVEFETREDDVENEPITMVPTDDKSVEKPEPGETRESLRNDALNEGAEDATIESLIDKTDITLDDLRKLPGTEGLTDQQLQTAWAAAQKEAGVTETALEDKKVELPFPVYDEKGNKIAADKVTLGDLLSGKALIGYNAMEKEQRKTLADVIRNASQGHWNDHRYNTVNEQYRQAHGRVTELQGQVAKFTEQQSQWNSALTALVMGDNAPMKALVEAYKGALGKTGMAPEGFIPQDTVTAEREATERGMQWYQEVGMPAAIDIAGRYSADPKEVIGAIKYFIENEPVLTQARIQEILQYDVPMAFEANGYVAKGKSTESTNTNTESSSEVGELKKQIEALTQRLAGSTNNRTEEIRSKNRKAPAAGSGSTPGAGDAMPTFKNRDQMKDWLRS